MATHVHTIEWNINYSTGEEFKIWEKEERPVLLEINNTRVGRSVLLVSIVTRQAGPEFDL